MILTRIARLPTKQIVDHYYLSVADNPQILTIGILDQIMLTSSLLETSHHLLTLAVCNFVRSETDREDILR